MSEDPFMRRCCLEEDGMCQGRIQWHHVLIVANKQLQKAFAIVGACEEYHHKNAERRDVKERFLFVVLNRATNQELESISKAINYSRMRDELNKKYEFLS